MEMHFPNHIPPTTYSPAAVTGRLRSLDQPEEANLSSEGAGQANGSMKNQRWAAESGHRSPPTPELPPLPGPFPPAHTSHIRHTPLRGARRPQRPVPSLPLALWRQTGNRSGGSMPCVHPDPQQGDSPRVSPQKAAVGKGTGMATGPARLPGAWILVNQKAAGNPHTGQTLQPNVTECFRMGDYFVWVYGSNSY